MRYHGICHRHVRSSECHGMVGLAGGLVGAISTLGHMFPSGGSIFDYEKRGGGRERERTRDDDEEDRTSTEPTPTKAKYQSN